MTERRSRPRGSDRRRRTAAAYVRLLPAELEAIGIRAKAAGKPVAGYLRDCALAEPPRVPAAGPDQHQPEAPVPGVTRWRRKPVEVEALEWTGENAEAIREFTGAPGGWSLVPAGWYAVRGEDAYPVLIDPGDLAARYEPAGETGAPAGPAPPVAADLDELARLKTACRTLARVVTGQVRAMEAARIEMAHGDLYAASQWILNSLPDVWDDPETEWDGKESAAEWWDRTDGFYRAAVADSGPADPRSPAPAAAEPAATATRPAEAIRIRVARALYDSLDRCARCKVCEHQCGAAADVAVEAVSAERERAEAAEAKLAAGDALIRDILEALCLRDGLSLESGITPGEPARNYELALRLGIGHVFGIKEAGDGLEARP